jgi:hypothetical protein
MPYESEDVCLIAGLSALLSGKTTLIDPSFGDVPLSAPSPALTVPAADVKKSVTAKMKKVSLFLIPMFLLLSFFPSSFYFLTVGACRRSGIPL